MELLPTVNSVNAVLEFFVELTPMEAGFWLLVQNVLQFVLCLLGGHLLLNAYSSRRITEPPERVTTKQLTLALVCIFLNTAVAVAGWFLWKYNFIHINMTVSWGALIDMSVLLVAMDFLMYVTHRIAHLPLIYPILHRTHHLEIRTRPLSLFVLSPLEVFGYGILWLSVLWIYHSSWLGIVLYLLLNAAFGTLGHLGVEPFPKRWLSIPLLRHLTTSTFHAQHHLDGEVNFGFYTDVWDGLAGTLSKGYEKLVKESASKSAAVQTAKN